MCTFIAEEETMRAADLRLILSSLEHLFTGKDHARSVGEIVRTTYKIFTGKTAIKNKRKEINLHLNSEANYEMKQRPPLTSLQ